MSAGLLIQSFRRVLQADPGFKAQNLLTMQGLTGGGEKTVRLRYHVSPAYFQTMED